MTFFLKKIYKKFGGGGARRSLRSRLGWSLVILSSDQPRPPGIYFFCAKKWLNSRITTSLYPLTGGYGTWKSIQTKGLGILVSLIKQ